jgi:asparagine synthase (glutamine-hydrolysing)
MCGIAALLAATATTAPPDRDRIGRMTRAIAHRGPDADGHWLDPEAGVALGHRRLSIIDLSEAGAQPMASACGRYVIVFNGEIYNHLSLRKRLASESRAPDWRGHSDTETLLAAIAAWGLDAALDAVCGMFALALWDRETATLCLARDRMGEKPLHYGRIGEHWAVASELHALRALPEAELRSDPAAVTAYLARGYVPDGMSIHQGLAKVAPGTIVTLARDRAPETRHFGGFAALADEGRTRGLSAPDPEARARHLEDLLAEVVGEQMLSDVPLGSFLSGGIDSSLVTALMQAGAARQVESFSVGFTDARFDESPHAEAVARHLGTAHTAFRISEEDALDLIPQLPQIYDEPFADSSQIPTALLCRAARARVTVALTGDGADEIFGGYNRHVLGPRLMRRLAPVPGALRRPLGRMLARLDGVGASGGAVQGMARRLGLPVTLIDKLGRLGTVVESAGDIPALYAVLTRGLPDPRVLMTPAARGAALNDPALPDGLAGLGGADWMMAQDALGYLPGDILVKVDRAAMATSLETRAPFLDARVVAAGWALPQGDRIADGRGKAVLRRILARHVPTELTERPKQGFAVPLDRWLREGLHDWAAGLLAREDLLAATGLDRSAVRGLWSRHQTRRANLGQTLWTVLMLLAWMDRTQTASAPQ